MFDTASVLVVALLVVLVLVPIAVGVPIPGDGGQEFPTAQEAGNTTAPGDFTNWQGSLEWMQNNTPAEGDWDNANNEFAYYGTYEQTDDHDYPAGSYGVMSWWDYGHWITVEAERIPNANPFQEGATTAANYLLAPSEERANEILQELDEDDAKTRYVMVDWQMVHPDSKFGAPIVFYNDGDETRSDFYKYMFAAQETPQGKQYRYFQTIKSQRYFESMMVRLYRYHGSAEQPQPVVVDWDQERQTQYGPTLLSDNRNTTLRSFDNMSAAREFVEQDGTSQVGGIRNMPSEYVPALQHYRLVAVSEKHLAPANYILNGDLSNVPTYVKTFERVPGATVKGTGPANTTVTATVTMEIPAFNGSRLGSFEYTQRAQTGPDGTFTMVLPYSTTGYENWGPEDGHTNVSVRAAGPYEFSTGPTGEGDGNLTKVVYNDTAAVTEAQVIGEDDSTVTVELERSVVDVPGGANNSSSARMSTDAATTGDTSESQSSLAGTTFATLGPSVGVLGAFLVTTRRWSA